MCFLSPYSYLTFSYQVKNRDRFLTKEKNRSFLKGIKETWDSRIKTLAKGEKNFRAQMGCQAEEKFDEDDILYDVKSNPLKNERMFPSKDHACEGRLNPKGIIVLYTSTSKNTAMSELRPWIGTKITVGEFHTTKKFKVIDLSEDKWFPYYEEESDYSEEDVVWGDINYAFSEPVENSLTSAEYVPTQILSEYFRSNGFDAIIHKSSLGDDKNIAFFNIKDVQIETKEVKKVSSVNYEFSNAI